MATGWVQDQTDGGWYNFGDDGVMQTGWIEDGGNWYYLHENGVAAQNEWVDGEYLGSDGAWIAETPGN
jgi:glucan-binding YG repeat protein